MEFVHKPANILMLNYVEALNDGNIISDHKCTAQLIRDVSGNKIGIKFKLQIQQSSVLRFLILIGEVDLFGDVEKVNFADFSELANHGQRLIIAEAYSRLPNAKVNLPVHEFDQESMNDLFEQLR